jgi:hypothetical protein
MSDILSYLEETFRMGTGLYTSGGPDISGEIIEELM